MTAPNVSSLTSLPTTPPHTPTGVDDPSILPLLTQLISLEASNRAIQQANKTLERHIDCENLRRENHMKEEYYYNRHARLAGEVERRKEQLKGHAGSNSVVTTRLMDSSSSGVGSSGGVTPYSSGGTTPSSIDEVNVRAKAPVDPPPRVAKDVELKRWYEAEAEAWRKNNARHHSYNPSSIFTQGGTPITVNSAATTEADVVGPELALNPSPSNATMHGAAVSVKSVGAGPSDVKGKVKVVSSGKSVKTSGSFDSEWTVSTNFQTTTGTKCEECEEEERAKAKAREAVTKGKPKGKDPKSKASSTKSKK